MLKRPLKLLHCLKKLASFCRKGENPIKLIPNAKTYGALYISLYRYVCNHTVFIVVGRWIQLERDRVALFYRKPGRQG